MVLDESILYERLILELVIGSVPYCVLLLLILTRVCQILHLPLNYDKELAISLKFKILMTFFLALLLIFATISSYIFNDFWIHEADCQYGLVYVFHSFVLAMQIFLMCYEFKKQVPTPWYINLLFWAVISLLYFIFLMNSILFLVFFAYFLFFSYFFIFLHISSYFFIFLHISSYFFIFLHISSYFFIFFTFLHIFSYFSS